jgi:hypothetical protein
MPLGAERDELIGSKCVQAASVVGLVHELGLECSAGEKLPDSGSDAR